MYKVLKATETVGGTTAYRAKLLDRVLEDLASQLNDASAGIVKVCDVELSITDTEIHAVALVEVEDKKKK